jgi:hypothetical protein
VDDDEGDAVRCPRGLLDDIVIALALDPLYSFVVKQPAASLASGILVGPDR